MEKSHLTQSHLIDNILWDLNLLGKGRKQTTPASPSRILKRSSEFEDFGNSFHYRYVIGKLNYLERWSWSDISYIFYQCARFSTFPEKEHNEAIKWLRWYLLYTRDKGTMFNSNTNNDMEVYIDANFGWNIDSQDNQSRDTGRSRHGYIVMYKRWLTRWKL